MARPNRDDREPEGGRRPRRDRRPSRGGTGVPATAVRLRAEHARLTTAVDGLPHGLLLLDRRFRVAFCNRPFLGLLGLGPEAAADLGSARVGRLLRRAEAAGGLPTRAPRAAASGDAGRRSWPRPGTTRPATRRRQRGCNSRAVARSRWRTGPARTAGRPSRSRT